MTQNRNMVKKLCFASAGIASVAVVFAVWFTADASVVVGQTPAPQDVSTTPAISAGAQNMQPPMVNNASALRAQIAQLQATLQKAPTSAEEHVAQQQAFAELSNLQAQLQRLETTASQYNQYSAYRQALDAQATLQSAAEPFGAPMSGDLYSPASRQAILDASGLNSGNLGNRIGGDALTQGEAALLREQKNGLTQQYRQLQQTLRALQPGDEALADNLRKEQEALLSQLKEIDARLVNAPTSAPSPNVTAPYPDPNFVVPQANMLNFDAPPADVTLERIQKANQAAQLLREAGLVQLAGHVANELPRMTSPNFTETNLVAGAWAQSSGLAEENNNPFHTVSPKDIQGINDSIGALKSQIETLSQKLADVETQLKLLTHQQVSGYIAPQQQSETSSPVAPVQDEVPAAELPTDAVEADAIPGEASLGLGEFRALTNEDYQALLQ